MQPCMQLSRRDGCQCGKEVPSRARKGSRACREGVRRSACSVMQGTILAAPVVVLRYPWKQQSTPCHQPALRSTSLCMPQTAGHQALTMMEQGSLTVHMNAGG